MKNIVIIIIDALRPKNLSLFGYNKETDKNLKEIAKESTLFRNFFSVSNSTFPTITSLFTGKYPKTHGIMHQAPYATPEEYEKLLAIEQPKFWLPTYLKNKGYYTIGIDWIGLWFKEGFEYYGEKKEAFYKKFTKNAAVKKILLNLPSWAYKFGKSFVKNKNEKLFPSAKQMADLAIDKVKEAEKLNKPFFLFMHFEDTHFPYPNVPKPELSGENDINEVLEKINTDSQREYFKKRVADIELASIKDMKNKYDLAITGIDEQIGRIRNFLIENEQWEDTMFIILSDHGDCLDEHGVYFSHASLFDESVHVPLIMKIPNFKSREINEFAQTPDIAPTILEGFGDKGDFEGKSVISLIKKGNPLRDKVLLYDGLAPDVKAVRTKKRKLIIANGNKCNLCKSEHHAKIEEYDLEKDPNETNNIYSGKSELMEFIK
ncbi:sulfatase [Candidatus Pacearchaeota archaeon]|nr:sulfatase [Candidatus Pacearchaeota archaeon]